VENGTKCLACDVDLPASRGSRPRKWCSDKCRSWARLNPDGKRPVGRTCKGCGVGIDHLMTKAIYCTQACGQRSRDRDMQVKLPLRPCLQCGRQFQPYRSNSTCCSVRHYRTWCQKQWYAGNRDVARERRIQMRARMTEEQRARQRALGRLHSQVRRARKKLSLYIRFTEVQLAQRMAMFAGCWMCGGPFEHIEHVKPLAVGGPHILANLRPSCAPCNLSKGGRWPLEVHRAVARPRIPR
jgi:5-methylcytosine-specific restriction endonuclease McrA